MANRNSRVNIWGRESVDEESAWGLSAGMGARGVQPPQQHRAVGRVARRSPDVGATTLTWLGAGVGGFVGPQGERASGRCSRCSSPSLSRRGVGVPDVVRRADRWETWFAPDQDFEFLVSGVTSGFSYETLPREQSSLGFEVANYVPPEHIGKATADVERQIELGRVITTTFDRVNGVSAIGIVDKQRSGFVKHRLVHDLSRPDGASTNEHAHV